MVTLIKGVPHAVDLHDGRRLGVARRLSGEFLDTLVAHIEPPKAPDAVP